MNLTEIKENELTVTLHLKNYNVLIASNKPYHQALFVTLVTMSLKTVVNLLINS